MWGLNEKHLEATDKRKTIMGIQEYLEGLLNGGLKEIKYRYTPLYNF